MRYAIPSSIVSDRVWTTYSSKLEILRLRAPMGLYCNIYGTVLHHGFFTLAFLTQLIAVVEVSRLSIRCLSLWLLLLNVRSFTQLDTSSSWASFSGDWSPLYSNTQANEQRVSVGKQNDLASAGRTRGIVQCVLSYHPGVCTTEDHSLNWWWHLGGVVRICFWQMTFLHGL